MEPPVELSELMERIRSAVGAQRRSDALPAEEPSRPIHPAIPPPLPAPPAFAAMPRDDRDKIAFLEAASEAASMLPRARHKTEVSPSVPKMLRSLYRNQGGFNGILLETVSRLLEANQHLQHENAELQARLERVENAVANQHDWANGAAAAHAQQREWMKAVESYLLEVGGSQEEVELRLRLKHAHSTAQAILPAATQSPDYDEEWMEAMQDQVNTVGSHADRLGDHLKNLQAQVDEQDKRASNEYRRQDWTTEYRQMAAHQERFERDARRLEERQHNDSSYVKNQLWFLERLIQPLLTKPEVGNTAVEQPAVEGGEHNLDALYLAFENVMRGSRDEVKKRVGVYLPYVALANAGTTARPVLDLGCGRGEWLELLREKQLVSAGVDLNTCMVEVCRERGLPVTFANAIDHLQTLPDASCGAVTAFHLIEHLPVPILVKFLRECRRVLQPGGVAIFETPNPYNVLVGSGYFYHDFTHQRPLPPASTQFLVEQLGFATAEILPLHPWDDASKVHGEDAKALEWRFNELFYGPQDYALIARP